MRDYGKEIANVLVEWGLDAPDFDESCSAWPDEQLHELHDIVTEILSESTSSAIANATKWNKEYVVYPAWLKTNFEPLLKRCLLYADRTILRMRWIRRESPRNEVVDQLKRIISLVPFLRSGRFLPVNTALFDQQIDGTILELLIEAQSVFQHVAAHVQVGSGVIPIPVVGGGSPPVEALFLSATLDDGFGIFGGKVTIPASTTVGPIPVRGELPELPPHAWIDDTSAREFVHRLAHLRLQRLLQDWNSATSTFHCTLATSSELAWSLLCEIEALAGNVEGNKQDRALAVYELPYLDHVPAELIADQRDKLEAYLPALRASLKAFTKEVRGAVDAGESKDAIDAIRERHLHGPIRELDRRLRSNIRQVISEGASYFVLSSIVTLAFATATPPAPIQVPLAATTAIGLALGRMFASWQKETSGLEASPLYMLWQAKRSGVVH